MIYLFQSMIWSKLSWDLSWADKIEISKLLPKINCSYPIVLEREEDYAEEGKALFLWLPPHSELNGWFDKRPSEILKSYVLEGTLTNPSSNNLKFDFYLEKITSLIETFNRVSKTDKSPLPTLGLPGGVSCIWWERSRNLSKAKVGNYLYLDGVDNETQFESIFSMKNNKLCLHYSACLTPSYYEIIVTKYYLNNKEQSIFETLFSKAKEIYEPELESISEYEVRGAEYY